MLVKVTGRSQDSLNSQVRRRVLPHTGYQFVVVGEGKKRIRTLIRARYHLLRVGRLVEIVLMSERYILSSRLTVGEIPVCGDPPLFLVNA